MDERSAGRYQNKILTIPNLLSLFRLLLVPVFCWTYLILDNVWLTAGVLAISGLTDVADGYIARRFDMVSDVGKVLDPIADKFTQAAVLICLIFRFPIMLPAFVALAVKEVTGGITGLIVLKKTGIVLSAKWHGKVATAVLYLVMTTLVIWRDCPYGVAFAMMLVCVALLVLSLALYTKQNLGILREHGKK